MKLAAKAGGNGMKDAFVANFIGKEDKNTDEHKNDEHCEKDNASIDNLLRIFIFFHKKYPLKSGHRNQKRYPL